MDLVYVKRNPSNEVVSLYRHRQDAPEPPERLPLDHPDVEDFRTRRLARNTPQARMRRSIANDPFRKALVKLMATERTITNQEMVQLLVDQLQP